jgi:peptidoglycan/xylan/chitin deacetylase (PgdA/CDA1 family)
VSAPAGSRVVVLAYHAIADYRDDPVLAKWSVTPELFARQLDAILAAGYSFVDLETVLAGLAGERPLPRRGVLLTFDDAYADLLPTALPLLRRHRAPAVVFAVAANVGGTNSWDQQDARVVDLLDAEGLKAVAAAGIEIGSHTSTHRPLGKVPAEELDEELAGAAARLEALGLPRPRSFAYPYGDCSEELGAAVERAGYSVGFTIQPGALRAGDGANRFLLPRVVVLGTDSPRRLRLKLRAAAWPYGLQRRFLRLLRLEP